MIAKALQGKALAILGLRFPYAGGRLLVSFPQIFCTFALADILLNMAEKNNRDSPLVKSVLALDSYLAELERVGGKINSTDMASHFDVEHIQKLMTRFAECGKGISEQVVNFSAQLQEAQRRAETVAQGVSGQ